MQLTSASTPRPAQTTTAASTVVNSVGGPFSVVVARTADELEPYRDRWADLAENCVEPNVFYEPWMLLPALREFGEANLRVLFFFDGDKVEGAPLCGVFPVVSRRGYKKIPVRLLTLWRHLYCFSCTPLLRVGRSVECLSAFYEWAGSVEGVSLVEMPLVTSDGHFHGAWVREAHQSKRLHYIDEEYGRALYRPEVDAYEYWRIHLRRKHRQDYGRVERRLAEQGKLEYRLIGPEDDVDAWIADFLSLEAKGWKGEEGTAMGCAERGRAFFSAMAKNAHESGRALFHGSYFDGRPLAMLCTLRSGAGAFTFKIAYDEEYASYSPGVQMIKRLMEHFDGDGSLDWVDSCAVPGHPMIDRLWAERRLMRTVVTATGRWPGDWVVSVLPMLRWLKRKFRR